MEKEQKLYFKKKRTVPPKMVSNDIQFESGELGIIVTPDKKYLFIEDNEGMALIGDFAGENVDWGRCYFTMKVPYEWLTTKIINS